MIADYENFWKPKIDTIANQKPYDLRTRAILLKSYSKPLTQLGESLKKEENYKDLSDKIFTQAIEISNDNAPALHDLAQSYLSQNDFQKAEELETKALKIDPNQYQSHKTLGSLYLKQNNKKKAYFHLRKYLNLAPDAQDRQQIEEVVEKLKKEL